MANEISLAPTAPHVRETTLAADGWRWIDEERHACTKPPTQPEVLRDKLAEHGVVHVVASIGLGRSTILSLASGVVGTMSTAHYCQAKLSELALLDRAADYRRGQSKATP